MNSRTPADAPPSPATRYVAVGKRSVDVLIIALLSAPLIPLFALLYLLVRIDLGRPVIFKQARTGLGCRLFQIYKFRTMTREVDAHGEPLPDERRITRIGALLRATSLDELPELWNVLRGDMSLVGPRPLLPEYLPLYSQRQALRHRVRPGITGLAQVSGRNQLDWADRLELDVRYVESVGLALDLRILFRTIGEVFTRRGISAQGHVTMPRFHGASRDEGAQTQGPQNDTSSRRQGNRF